MIEVWEFPSPQFNTYGGSIIPVKTEFPDAVTYAVYDGRLNLYRERTPDPMATYAAGVWKKVIVK